VLTSRGTGSAAEEFSFVLKNRGRATIVGDRTAGAGHMVRAVDVGQGFVAGISFTRVMDARSGLEWERDGVQPDVRVAPERALDAAHAAALRTIARVATTDDARRRTLELLAEAVDARGTGAPLAPARLAALAGTYEGDREVLAQQGRLWYRARPGAMAEELVPLANGRFAIGATRLAFEPGATPRLVIERPDGTRLSYARVRNEP
jgi:retinol-binding protein 3